MSSLLLKHEPLIRLSCYFGALALFAICEGFFPRRPHTLQRRSRWPANIGVAFVDSFVLRLLIPAGAVGFAFWVRNHEWGVFNMVSIPGWISVVTSVIVLDFVIYLQHRAFHYQPILWRLHRMHHADLDVDVTTGARFHPMEILISLAIKFGAISAMGAPPLGVLLFEVLLNATSMFNHSNIFIPARLERVVRWFVVTPDMHRVHHSIVVPETNSNFGFNLSIWDRLFGTYRPQPAAGHDGITLGIEQFRDPKELRLFRMLLQPFRRE